MTVQLSGVSTQLLIDTGAQASVISKTVLNQLPPRVTLNPSSSSLKHYGGGCIPLCGTISVSVRYKEQLVPNFKFFVVQNGASVLGQDLFDALNFHIVDDTALKIRTVQVRSRNPTDVNPLHRDESVDTPACKLDVPTSGVDVSCARHDLLQRYRSILDVDPKKSIKGYIHKPVVNKLLPPVAQAQRRVPLALLDKVKSELERMVHDGVLKQVEAADWVSNMVIARKANGAIRICVDLTDVNKAIVPDRYPLPTIDELSEFFAGSRFFSKIDLKWGYLQVQLHESSRYLTAMITPYGLYEWQRLPFGLCSAPSNFQKIVADLISGIPGVKNLLDDIIVCGKTQAEHDSRLERVLKSLATHDVVINADKSAFGVSAVDFVGHRVTSQGVSPLQSNVEAISMLEAPDSLKGLRSFIGAASFYRKFVPHFSDIVEPLNELLRGDATFAWSEERQRAFDRLKRELTSSQVLAHFDLELQTQVTTDASGVAIGAVLSQTQHDGSERPVAFASRTLTSTERAYSVSEREALACIWACERWHWYLYGRQFTLRTDHSALTALLAGGSKGRKPMRLLRWADRLNEYQFSVVYRPGVDNVVADLLSRSEVKPPGETVQPQSVTSTADTDLYVRTIFGNSSLNGLGLTDLADATAKDEVLQRVVQRCTSGWLKSDSRDSAISAYSKVSIDLSLEAGVLFRGEQAVVPISLQQQVLQLAHEGHPGIVKMRQRLRDCVWWPGINNDVDRHVKHCQACLLSDKSARPVTPPLHPISFPPKPWHTVALDIKGELHGSPSRWRYLIVAYDLHSKWPEVRAVNTVTSSAVISFLQELFSRWGLPAKIITDNGKQFVSRQIEDFFTSLGIHHSRTALYHPQANGAVERFNRYLTDQLRLARVENKPVDDAIFIALSMYRSTRHCTTQRSPAELMCGRAMTMPLDRLCKRPPPKAVTFQLDGDVRLAQSRQARNYNKLHNVKQFGASTGQQVHVRENVRANKYEPLWSQPRGIAAKLSDTTVRLDNGTVRNSADLVPARSVQANLDPLPFSEPIQVAANPPVPNLAPPLAVTVPHVASELEPDNAPALQLDAPPVRRSARTRKPPAYLADYV